MILEVVGGYVKPIGDRLTLAVSDVPGGVRAELVIMDAHAGDILLQAFLAPTADKAEAAAGKYLRELGRLVDGIPTVTCIDVRNDPLPMHIELAPEGDRYEYIGDPEPFDLLKVMVQLEHEGPRAPTRTIHTVFVDRDALSQNVNAGTYAIGFAVRPSDPVTEHYVTLGRHISERVVRGPAGHARHLDAPPSGATDVARPTPDLDDELDDADELDGLDLGSLGGATLGDEGRSRGRRRARRP